MPTKIENDIHMLKTQMAELQRLVQNIVNDRPYSKWSAETNSSNAKQSSGYVYYTGQYQTDGQLLRWDPKSRDLEQLLSVGTEKISKILSALGSKPRLDIMMSVLTESLTGAEIVDKLGLGTTGQLYHHLKALQGADLLAQDKSGRYSLSDHRKLPLLLLLAAVVDMLDTSDYLAMVEVRNSAGAYLGNTSKEGFDANLLLWAVLENAILEHVAGYVDEIHLFFHHNGEVTVSDNGRGIPVKAFPERNQSTVQTVLTDIERFNSLAPYQAPGAEKGISIAIVNALAHRLTVQVQRDGFVYRQDYRNGIPQTELTTVGITKSSGTSITFKPDQEIFKNTFRMEAIREQVEVVAASYPGLSIHLHKDE